MAQHHLAVIAAICFPAWWHLEFDDVTENPLHYQLNGSLPLLADQLFLHDSPHRLTPSPQAATHQMAVAQVPFLGDLGPMLSAKLKHEKFQVSWDQLSQLF
jgi:hypothetical protein